MENREKYTKNAEMRGIICPWSISDKGKYVHSGPMSCNMNGIIGRVVQVRKGTGVFGTDTVLVREQNGILSSHVNQFFFIIPDKYKAELDEKFKGIPEDDADKVEYTICGKDPVLGFLS